MTGPVERVPLTDEHLLQLETLWLGPTGTGRTSEELTAARLEQFGRIALEDVPGLLAELRASRARERELRSALGVANTIPSDEWAGDDPWRRGYVTGCEASHSIGCDAVAAERYVLRERISKALEVCDSPDGSAVAENTDEGTRFMTTFRAALTGTETHRGTTPEGPTT